jgi:hypothetical protein
MKCIHKTIFRTYVPLNEEFFMKMTQEGVYLPENIVPRMREKDRTWNELSLQEKNEILEENKTRKFPLNTNCECDNELT